MKQTKKNPFLLPLMILVEVNKLLNYNSASALEKVSFLLL